MEFLACMFILTFLVFFLTDSNNFKKYGKLENTILGFTLAASFFSIVYMSIQLALFYTGR